VLLSKQESQVCFRARKKAATRTKESAKKKSCFGARKANKTTMTKESAKKKSCFEARKANKTTMTKDSKEKK